MSNNHDLRHWALHEPHRLAISSGEHSWTYGELESAVNRMAQSYRALGLVRGEHIVALLPNGISPFLMAWAAYRSGLYFTPIPTTLTAAEVAYLIDNSEARAVVIDACFADVAAALPSMVPGQPRWLSIRGVLPDFESLDDRMANSPATPRDEESPGTLMFYTSGTTGRPKGVIRPLLLPGHVGPPPFALDLLALFDIDANARYLSTAPLYHAAPLRFALTVTAAGGTVYLMDRFDATTALDIIESEGITHSQWVPTMFQRLLKLPSERRRLHNAPAHRIALHSAAPCPIDVKRAMIDWWGPVLLEYYSGSEGVGLTSVDSEEWLARPGSVGKARKGRIRVLGEDDTELGPGETGRIYFSDSLPFQYFNEPEKTVARTSRQGWQTFGDIGHVDAEGYLFLTDRQDDMIISGGVNVYPQEIEEAIRQVAAVDDVAVVGLPHPDFGECPVAFVVPVATMAGLPHLVRDAVMAHCVSHLGRIKRPAEVRIVADLPRSPTGKLLRRVLRATSASTST